MNVLRLAPGGDGAADDRFDVYAADLADLAQQFIRGGGRSEEPGPMSPAQ